MIRIEKRLAGKAGLLAIVCIAMLTLSGCMYPKDQLKQNQIPPKEAVRNVQAAIEQFQAETGMLPIKNSTAETPVYEKFVIDFVKLQNRGYISDIPSAAFEKGGNYYFLVINEETKPAVKLLNLVHFQQMNDISASVTAYANANGGKLPKGGQAYPGFYYINFALLNKKAPNIASEYSGQTLTAMIDDKGLVYTDYGPDLMQKVTKEGDSAALEGDLRELLALSDLFVPIKSPVYHWVDGEPVAIAE
ncbi:hypothetical protein [Paenibacillus sp. NPDC058071]|uniref:hypothetical protein n=1 Tax=Paenibacillus sp. NPDC058071 TaxID=3346326 RepID=UPI0036D8EA42